MLYCLMSAALCVSASPADAGGLVELPCFGEALSEWEVYPPDFAVQRVPTDGSPTIKMTVTDDDTLEWYQIGYDVPAQAGDRFEATMEVLGRDLRDGNGIVLGMGFFDDSDQRIGSVEVPYRPGMGETWISLVDKMDQLAQIAVSSVRLRFWQP